MTVQELTLAITGETEKIIVGKTDRIRLILMSVLADGHVLLNDLPGVGKTTLVKSLSLALGCESRRLQFVPDMLPSDILGMEVYNQKTGEFELRLGPVMTHILLADEINRATPRTQSALLEAMEERQISINGEAHPLPHPFLVLATQNPVEMESTFRLPAAQMDRFLICLSMGYPTHEEELRMLGNLGDSIPFDTVESVASPEILKQARQEVSKVHVSREVAEYILRLAEKTREDKRVSMGVSPRGTRALYRAVKAWAAMAGRDYATADDVQSLVKPVWAHRIALESRSRMSGITAETVLDEYLDSVDAAPSLRADAKR